MPPSVGLELPSGVVLCIDDNQDLLECEKTFLESFGYTVLTAASCCERQAGTGIGFPPVD